MRFSVSFYESRHRRQNAHAPVNVNKIDDIHLALWVLSKALANRLAKM